MVDSYLVSKEEHNDEDIEVDEDDFDFPEDNDISDMLDEVPLESELPSVTDRYFTPYYKINVQRPNDDICIRIHSNRICMLTLAPSHPIFKENVKIESISFKVTEKLDRAANKVSGKGKHGAQPLQETSNICIINFKDGDKSEKWTVKCCMTGKLIEVNETLAENPDLIKQQPHKGGYLAIILPNIKVYEEMKKTLMTEDDYQKLVLQKKCVEAETNSKIEISGKRALEEGEDCSKEKIQKVSEI
uniref:Protein Abitram n=1 Tax=Bracon brevicornis TaxID=1563983 RepID=A0A6V7LC61_9HYME